MRLCLPVRGIVTCVHRVSEPTEDGGSSAVRSVYGISDNDRKYYSLERAREVLGYEPQDNSADHD